MAASLKTFRARIGVISDTHGLVRPEVLEAFNSVDLIVHAGDVGNAEVLKELRSIARVIAVRGNNDKGPWAKAIPETEIVRIGRVGVYILHNLKDLGGDPDVRSCQVVISGHSNRPSMGTRGGVLFLNPGSAGPRRFRLPITVARMTINGSAVNSEIIDLSQIS